MMFLTELLHWVFSPLIMRAKLRRCLRLLESRSEVEREVLREIESKIRSWETGPAWRRLAEIGETTAFESAEAEVFWTNLRWLAAAHKTPISDLPKSLRESSAINP